MRTVRVTYTLRDGSRRVIHVLAQSTCDALLIMMDHLGVAAGLMSAAPVLMGRRDG